MQDKIVEGKYKKANLKQIVKNLTHFKKKEATEAQCNIKKSLFHGISGAMNFLQVKLYLKENYIPKHIQSYPVFYCYEKLVYTEI